MKGDRDFMLIFFLELDKEIGEKFPNIQVSACILGGSFFVLHSLRENSPDIDFIIQDSRSYKILSEIGIPLAKKNGISLDIMFGNTLEKVQLPINYMRLAKPLKREKGKRKNLILWTMSPYYILLSKIARYSQKDKNDINLIMTSGKFTIRNQQFKKALDGFNPNSNQFSQNLEDFYNLYEKYFYLSWWEKIGLSKPIN